MTANIRRRRPDYLFWSPRFVALLGQTSLHQIQTKKKMENVKIVKQPSKFCSLTFYAFNFLPMNPHVRLLLGWSVGLLVRQLVYHISKKRHGNYDFYVSIV